MRKPAAVHSPFRYVGGKFYARNSIIPLLPEHQSYIEPFCGGASIYFAKDKVEQNWLNDLDEELIQTLICIRDQPEALAKLVSSYKIDSGMHDYFKNHFVPANALEVAARWFYLNRISYSGIMNKMNCYYSYNPRFTKPQSRWQDAIMLSSEKLQGVKITHLDFRQVIRQAPAGAVLFIDPPQSVNDRRDRFYKHGMAPQDHKDLAELLYQRRHELGFVLCASPDVLPAFEWAASVVAQWQKKAGRMDYAAELQQQKVAQQANIAGSLIYNAPQGLMSRSSSGSLGYALSE